jgi:hypothetical protein
MLIGLQVILASFTSTAYYFQAEPIHPCKNMVFIKYYLSCFPKVTELCSGFGPEGGTGPLGNIA